jgi:hypothetical protein
MYQCHDHVYGLLLDLALQEKDPSFIFKNGIGSTLGRNRLTKVESYLRDASCFVRLLISFGNSQDFLQGPYVECCISATIPD